MEIRSCSSTEPLEVWVKGPPRDGTCRSCSLVSLAVQYEQTLRAQGSPLADPFLRFLEGKSITPGSVAKRMDKIKVQVPDTLGAKLRGLDCELQQEG